MAPVTHADRASCDCPPFSKEPNAEPIPGYRLIEPLGSGGYGEVWKCEAPGGLLKAMKFVSGGPSALVNNGPVEEELRAIQRVKAIRHPFLLSMERVEDLEGELVIVMELADRSLHDLLTEYQRQGRSGIPRADLIGFLRETAEALDLMNLEHGLLHLDIKPRNLFLVSNHVKVGDFGLVNGMGWGKNGCSTSIQLGAITPLYASPEVFQGTISRHSDQYSLALVYQELLTGRLPFQGKNVRQLLLQHLQGEPDLSPLPEADRAVVARALAKTPEERFGSCSDFVRALAAEAGAAAPEPAGVRASVVPAGNGVGGETAPMPSAKADTDPAGLLPSGTGEQIAGHRLVSCLLCTPLTEVWKAQGPDGAERHVKIIYGYAPRGGQAEADQVARLPAMHHPRLAAVEILQQTPGRLMLATDPAGRTLRDRLQECQAQRQPGIPRAELLRYLRAAAEALHYLYQRHGVQHLALNPRNLLLDREGLRVADFGLAQLVWLPADQPVIKLNVRYAAPELLNKQVTPACDQFSLAVIYHEMLTGAHPQRGLTGAKAPGPSAAWSLDRLPAGDRAAIARALDPDPRRRWPSCVDLVKGLEEAPAHPAMEEKHNGGQDTVVRRPAGTTMRTTSAAVAGAASAQAVEAAAGNGHAPPAAEDVLRGTIATTQPLAVIRDRLEAFRQQWHGELVLDEPERLVVHMRTPRSFWQRWIGRRPGLEIHIRLTCPPAGSPAPTEAAVEIRPHGCGRRQSAEFVQIIAPLLLESLRNFFQVSGRRRTQERLVWHHPLQARCVYPDGKLGEAIDCKGKDISLNGIGFYLPRELPSSQVRLDLPQTPQTPPMTVPARIVRVQGCGDGWYEVGAVLLASVPKGD
jgi:serine/threonine protein kinase